MNRSIELRYYILSTNRIITPRGLRPTLFRSQKHIFQFPFKSEHLESSNFKLQRINVLTSERFKHCRSCSVGLGRRLGCRARHDPRKTDPEADRKTVNDEKRAPPRHSDSEGFQRENQQSRFFLKDASILVSACTPLSIGTCAVQKMIKFQLVSVLLQWALEAEALGDYENQADLYVDLQVSKTRPRELAQMQYFCSRMTDS